MSKVLDKVVDWLECEVTDLQNYADKFFNVSDINLSGSDFMNIGKHETAEELLRLIKEEWEDTDE